MGSVLDSILVYDLIDAPTTVNADFSTEGIPIHNGQDQFSVQIDYINGNGSVNMDIVLEVSNDNTTFVPMSSQNIITDTGSHIFDAIGGSGTRYLRISFTVVTGSIDVQKIFYNGKRLH